MQTRITGVAHHPLHLQLSIQSLQHSIISPQRNLWRNSNDFWQKKRAKKKPDEFSFVSLTMTTIELALFLLFFSLYSFADTCIVWTQKEKVGMDLDVVTVYEGDRATKSKNAKMRKSNSCIGRQCGYHMPVEIPWKILIFLGNNDNAGTFWDHSGRINFNIEIKWPNNVY